MAWLGKQFTAACILLLQERSRLKVKERASGYDIVDGHLANADFIDMSIPFSAGGIYSTVEDMYRWNEASSAPRQAAIVRLSETDVCRIPRGHARKTTLGVWGVISRLKFGQCSNTPAEVLEDFASYKPWELGDHVASDLLAISLCALRGRACRITAHRTLCRSETSLSRLCKRISAWPPH